MRDFSGLDNVNFFKQEDQNEEEEEEDHTYTYMSCSRPYRKDFFPLHIAAFFGENHIFVACRFFEPGKKKPIRTYVEKKKSHQLLFVTHANTTTTKTDRRKDEEELNGL